MRILNLSVSDFKRIVAADIVPAANVVEIAGKNAQGKSSLLDAIMVLLAGKKAIPDEPVRGGAERSVIEADVGDYVIRRTIKPDRTGTITVQTKDGMRAQSPQEVLDKLLGDLTFDPLLFVRQSPKDQLDMLRRFAGNVDFDALDAAEKEAFDERTSVNRDVKRLQAVVESYGDAAGEDGDEVDTSDLIDQLERARERNGRIRIAAGKRKDAETELASMREKRADAEAELVALRERIAAEEAIIAKLDADIGTLADRLKSAKPLPELEDESALTEQLRQAQEANNKRSAAAAQAAQIKADRKRLEEAKAEAERLTAAIQKAKDEREAALKAIDLPVKGLSMGEAGILFKGHPLSQASFAQQLQLGIALAMKANPKLKVAIVKEASMLDDDALAMLQDMAVREDFQVWIERVGAGSAEAIVIEEGEVKSAPKAARKPKAKA